jgi:hypothetical protein
MFSNNKHTRLLFLLVLTRFFTVQDLRIQLPNQKCFNIQLKICYILRWQLTLEAFPRLWLAYYSPGPIRAMKRFEVGSVILGMRCFKVSSTLAFRRKGQLKFYSFMVHSKMSQVAKKCFNIKWKKIFNTATLNYKRL